MKASLVERFSRTLKDSLTRLMIYRETVVWDDMIQRVIEGYNRTVNSTFKMAPLDVVNASDYEKHQLRGTLMPHTRMT